MAVYLKSLTYLGVFGTVGYVLMKISEPSEEKKRKIAGYESLSESKNQKALFLKKIQEATTDTPIYLKKASDKSAKPEEPNQPSKREIN